MKGKLSIMAKNDLGRTIIDELRLCYVAKSALLTELSGLGFNDLYYYGEFSLQRIENKHFNYYFIVFHSFDSDKFEIVASIRFGLKGSDENANYIYYRIENKVLYNNDMLRTTLMLPDNLGMVFHHITSIDLARDYVFDVVKRIRKFARTEKVKVIINGKVIDKTKDCKDGMFIFPLNFKRLANPTISIKQAKARKDKHKGLTMCVYNKDKEIKDVSHKNYIKSFYGNPKFLHRLEIHQNNDEIKDFCKTIGIKQVLSLIFNQDFLDEMFNTHLSSLLRFTMGRKTIKWNDILQ